MTSRELLHYLRGFWRIPAIALLAGAIAFAGSYLVQPTYEATTQLLIRGRDSTLLSTNGESLGDNPGVADAMLTDALSATQRALLSSRRVATIVVEELGLDEPAPEPASLMSRVRAGVRDIMTRAKALVRYGFYATPEPFARAVGEVHEKLHAERLEDSYVIELTAGAANPELAAAIADAAADALIVVSRDRFRAESSDYRTFLAQQVERAGVQEREAAVAVQQFKDEHGISDLDLEIQLSTTFEGQLRERLHAAQVDLRAARAELQAIRNSLASTSRTSSSRQQIATGRSTTTIEQSDTSTIYTDLATRREFLESEVASLEARVASLEEEIAPEEGQRLTGQQAELRQLELQYSIASDTYRTLSNRLQEAIVNAEDDRVEMTRLDTADAALFPASPRRYLFLALGMFLGGLAGFVLTVLLGRRDDPDAEAVAVAPPSTAGRSAHLENLAEDDPQPAQRIPAGVAAGGTGEGNGHGYGDGNGDGNGNGHRGDGDGVPVEGDPRRVGLGRFELLRGTAGAGPEPSADPVRVLTEVAVADPAGRFPLFPARDRREPSVVESGPEHDHIDVVIDADGPAHGEQPENADDDN